MAMVLRSSRLRLTQAILFGHPGGGGGAVSITGGNGITVTPSPITNVGNVKLGPLTGNWAAGNFRIDSQNSTREINVAEYATGGVGTTISPWTGWDVACPWAANTTFHFPRGQYNYSTPPAVSFDGIRLVGEGAGTVLNFLGVGNAIVFDGGAVVGDLENIGMQGFLIQGTATATNGVFARSVHRSFFRDIAVGNVTAAGFLANFMVKTAIERFQVSSFVAPWTTIPTNGIVLTWRAIGEVVISCLVSDAIVEHVSGTGIILGGTTNNQLISCVSANNNRGIEVGTDSVVNCITNFHGEGNAVEDILLSGPANTFVQPFCNGATSIHASGIYAKGNQFYGGYVNGVTVDALASDNAFDGLWFSSSGGAFTNNGTNTGVLNVWDATSLAYIQNAIRATLGVYGKIGIGATMPTTPAQTVELVGELRHSFDDSSNFTNYYWETWTATGAKSYYGILAKNYNTPASHPLTWSSGGEVGIMAPVPTRELDLNGTQRWRGIAAPAVSEANSGTIYYDSGSNTLKASLNGGAYVNLIGSGGVTGSGVAGKLAYWTSASNLTDEPNITLGGAYALDVAGDINLSSSGIIRYNSIPVFGTTIANGILWAGDTGPPVGNNSTSFGHQALLSATGIDNTAVGSLAGRLINTGTDNTAVGFNALNLTTTGNHNTVIGQLAGATNTTGSNNVCLGDIADVAAGNLTNAVAVGYQAVVAQNDSMQLGNAAMKVGIRTGGVPHTALDVGGQVSHRMGTIAVVNGLNSNIATPDTSYLRLTGPTGGFSVGGFTGGFDGNLLTIYNTVAFQMTIVNEDVSSTAANRIKTLTGGNVVLRAGTSSATFHYDTTDDRWVLTAQN